MEFKPKRTTWRQRLQSCISTGGTREGQETCIMLGGDRRWGVNYSLHIRVRPQPFTLVCRNLPKVSASERKCNGSTRQHSGLISHIQQSHERITCAHNCDKLLSVFSFLSDCCWFQLNRGQWLVLLTDMERVLLCSFKISNFYFCAAECHQRLPCDVTTNDTCHQIIQQS